MSALLVLAIIATCLIAAWVACVAACAWWLSIDDYTTTPREDRP